MNDTKHFRIYNFFSRENDAFSSHKFVIDTLANINIEYHENVLYHKNVTRKSYILHLKVIKVV